MMQYFWNGFEKESKIRGRSLRELRTLLAGGKIWSHATTPDSLGKILHEGLKPGRRLAREGKLSRIEGVPHLTPHEVSVIAEKGGAGYLDVQKSRNPKLVADNAIRHSPVDSVSFLRQRIPHPSNFGGAAVLGKFRQLNKSPKKIVREEGILPMSRISDPRAKPTLKWISESKPRDMVEKTHNFRGRKSSEGMIEKSRPIRMQPGQNVMIVPKADIQKMRQEHRQHRFVATEDMQKQYPDLYKNYHKK